MNKQEFLSVEEVAQLLQQSTATILRWRQSGELPGFFKINRKWLIKKTDLDNFISNKLSNNTEQNMQLTDGVVMNSVTKTIHCPGCNKESKVSDLLKELPNGVSHDAPRGWLVQRLEYNCPHCWFCVGVKINDLKI